MSDTTQFIRRRIQHWRTTLAGVAAIVCPIVALFCPPELSNKILAVAVMLSGSGLIAASDAKKQDK